MRKLVRTCVPMRELVRTCVPMRECVLAPACVRVLVCVILTRNTGCDVIRRSSSNAIYFFIFFYNYKIT